MTKNRAWTLEGPAGLDPVSPTQTGPEDRKSLSTCFYAESHLLQTLPLRIGVSNRHN